MTAQHVAFYRCSFHGYQDTLYAQIGIQFYKDCDIYGTIDFICGAAAAIFQDCRLYAVERTIKDLWTIEFTAQQRVSPAAKPASGFVIQNCTLDVAPRLKLQEDKFRGFLGRPWSVYSTVIVMNSILGKLIQPIRWDTWVKGVTPDTVFYRKFKNTGPGSDPNHRASWNGAIKHYPDIDPEEIKNFTVGKFINKDGWLARTLIPYYDGFQP